MTGQIAMLANATEPGKAFSKIINVAEKLTVRNAATLVAADSSSPSEKMEAPSTPYPISGAVARGLEEVFALGVLIGQPWARWPVTPNEGLPLCRIWPRIVAASAKEK